MKSGGDAGIADGKKDCISPGVPVGGNAAGKLTTCGGKT